MGGVFVGLLILAVAVSAVPSSILPDAITTCFSDEHCRMFGQQSATCDKSTYKCKPSSSANDLCTHFIGNGNTFSQCSSVAATTESITLYYAIINVGADCDKEIAFITPYNLLITKVLGESSSTPSSEIVHHCYGGALKTSVKYTVMIKDILAAKDTVLNIGKLLNDELSNPAVDPVAKSVGTVDRQLIGTSESYPNLCDPIEGAQVSIPFSETPTSEVYAFRDCEVVKCSDGFVYSSNLRTPSCIRFAPLPSYLVTIDFDVTGILDNIMKLVPGIIEQTAKGLTTETTNSTVECINVCTLLGCVSCQTQSHFRSIETMDSSLHTISLLGGTAKAVETAKTDVELLLEDFFKTGAVLDVTLSSNIRITPHGTPGDESMTGTIAGLVVASIVFVVMVGTVVYFLYCRSGPESQHMVDDAKNNPDGDGDGDGDDAP